MSSPAIVHEPITVEAIEEAIYQSVAIWNQDGPAEGDTVPWSEVKGTKRFWVVDGAFDADLIETMAADVYALLTQGSGVRQTNRLSGVDPRYHIAELIEIYRGAAAIEAGEQGPWLMTGKYPCSIAGIEAVKDALLAPVKAEVVR